MIIDSSIAFLGPFLVPSCSITSQDIPALIDILIQRSLISILVVLILKVLSNQYRFPFILRSGFLGFVASSSFYTFSHHWYKETLTPEDHGGIAGSLFFFFLSTFHFLEYFATALTIPNEVTTEAFLLNQSPEYHMAMGFSIVEFFVELSFFPLSKSYSFFILFGTILCFLSELVRKGAMLHAGHNFTHLIQSKKRDKHVLVKDGIYGVWRHPSYVGWFYWCLGTQIILQNPFCFAGFAIVSWRFFHSRIYYEELTLIQFFGHQYIQYKKSVPTGLPFIDGVPLYSTEK